MADLWFGAYGKGEENHALAAVMQLQSARSQMPEPGTISRQGLQDWFALQRVYQQGERMGVTSQYQNWQQDFAYQGNLQQRQWVKEDWQYRDTRDDLQFGWGMEDMNEDIRYASGRQRRRLIEQRDRMTTLHNLDEGQEERTKERQGEEWAREDERYEKQKQYTLEIQRMDKEGFELSLEQRKTMYRLDREGGGQRTKAYEEQKKQDSELQDQARKYGEAQAEAPTGGDGGADQGGGAAADL